MRIQLFLVNLMQSELVAIRDIIPCKTLLVRKSCAAVLCSPMRYNYCWYYRKQTWSRVLTR